MKTIPKTVGTVGSQQMQSGVLGVLGALLWAGTFSVLAVTSCGDSGSSEEVCTDCTSGVVWDCYGGILPSGRRYRGSLCVSVSYSYIDVLDDCNTEFGGPFWTANVAELAPCENLGGGETDADNSESSCTDWDPDDNITLVSGVYEIEESFVDYIQEDPMRLVNCDTSRVRYSSSNSEYLVLATSGSILYELGFRTNDVVVTVNGHDLDTHSDAAGAYGTEFLEDGETEYSFKLIRGSNPVTISVEIVP